MYVYIYVYIYILYNIYVCICIHMYTIHLTHQYTRAREYTHTHTHKHTHTHAFDARSTKGARAYSMPLSFIVFVYCFFFLQILADERGHNLPHLIYAIVIYSMAIYASVKLQPLIDHEVFSFPPSFSCFLAIYLYIYKKCVYTYTCVCIYISII